MILFFENRRGNTRRGRQAPKNKNGKYSGNRLKYTPSARRGGLREIGWRQMQGTSHLPTAVRRNTAIKLMSNAGCRVKNVEVRNRRLCQQHVV